MEKRWLPRVNSIKKSFLVYMFAKTECKGTIHWFPTLVPESVPASILFFTAWGVIPSLSPASLAERRGGRLPDLFSISSSWEGFTSKVYGVPTLSINVSPVVMACFSVVAG